MASMDKQPDPVALQARIAELEAALRSLTFDEYEGPEQCDHCQRNQLIVMAAVVPTQGEREGGNAD